MQSQQRQQILKLLSLDSMIDEYLNEPVKQQNKLLREQTKIFKHRRQAKPQKLLATVDTASLNREKKVRSAKNISKKDLSSTISPTRGHSVRNFVRKNGEESRSCRLQGQYQTSKELVKQKKETASTEKSENQMNCLRDCPKMTFKENGSARKYQKYMSLHKKGPGVSSKFNLHLLKSRYRLEKVIGRGLSGLVYKARDVLSERDVAIKIISADNVEHQFIKQMQHQNIIEYYNSFMEQSKRYLVLEYFPLTLQEVLKKKFELVQHKLIFLFRSIASGLMYLHSMSWAHRDIKLDNIVTDEELTVVKFIDFGLCVDVNEMEPKESIRFCGTTSYISPQILSGKCRDAKKADIWALGVVFYTLAVGRNPFKGRHQIQIYNKIRNNKAIFPKEMSEELKKLLAQMLNKNPEDRPLISEIVNSSWLTYD